MDCAAEDSVPFKVKILNAIRRHERCPDELNTDGTFWPFGLVFAQEVSRSLRDQSLDQSLIDKLLAGFLLSLMNRAENLGRQALLLEKHIVDSENGEDIDYANFRERYLEDSGNIDTLLKVYDGLFDILSKLTENFVKNCVEFSRRLLDDKEDIGKKIFKQPIDLTQIESLTVTDGETHSNHQVVLMLRLKNGSGLGYKPRDLTFEAAITEVLNKYIDHSENESIVGWVLPKYLCRGEYGWVEWLDQYEVKIPAEVQRFYIRSGFLIAFCTFFTITDLHSGNIIAHGSSPVPVDLEASMTHTKKFIDGSKTISEELQWNCTSTNLLPSWTWKGADMVGVDLSGLGGLEEQYCSLSLYQYDPVSGIYTQDGVMLHPDKNVLYLNGIKQRPYDHISHIERGFRICSSSIQKNPQRQLNVLNQLKNLGTRYINRATAGYHYAIMCSLHPSYLIDVRKREDFIRSCLIETDYSSPLLVESEVKSCIQCDVPRFCTTPATLATKDEFTGEVVQLDDDLLETGSSLSERYLKYYNQERERFELKLLNGTLIALGVAYRSDTFINQFPQLPSVCKTYNGSSSKQLMRKALPQLASYLKEYISDEYRSGFNWYGFKTSAADLMEYTVLGDDFYSGMSGIIYAAMIITKSGIETIDNIDEIFDGYIQEIKSSFEHGNVKIGGAYLGLCSTLLPIVSLDNADSSNRLLDSAYTQIKNSLNKSTGVSHFWGTDIFGGISGLTSVSANLFKITSDQRWLEVALSSFRELQKAGNQIDGKTLFPHTRAVSRHQTGCLTGLSHGQIGIALAISDLHSIVDSGPVKDEVSELITDLVGWEIEQYNIGHKNWPDLRTRARSPDEGETLLTHGSPGIYLALDKISKSGFDIAKNFIKDRPFADSLNHIIGHSGSPVSDCLGNGGMGVILSALRVMGHTYEKELLDLSQWTNLQEMIANNAMSSRVRIADVPGFMVGKAGVALAYAELSNACNYITPLLPSDFVANVRRQDLETYKGKLSQIT